MQSQKALSAFKNPLNRFQRHLLTDWLLMSAEKNHGFTFSSKNICLPQGHITALLRVLIENCKYFQLTFEIPVFRHYFDYKVLGLPQNLFWHVNVHPRWDQHQMSELLYCIPLIKQTSAHTIAVATISTTYQCSIVNIRLDKTK